MDAVVTLDVCAGAGSSETAVTVSSMSAATVSTAVDEDPSRAASSSCTEGRLSAGLSFRLLAILNELMVMELSVLQIALPYPSFHQVSRTSHHQTLDWASSSSWRAPWQFSTLSWVSVLWVDCVSKAYLFPKTVMQ